MVKIHTELIETQCTICLEHHTYKDLHTLPCGHKFHKNCIFKWMENMDLSQAYTKYQDVPIKGTCPICRRECNSIIYGKFGRCSCLIR